MCFLITHAVSSRTCCGISEMLKQVHHEIPEEMQYRFERGLLGKYLITDY